MASYRQRGRAELWYYRFVNENGKQVERKGSRSRRETELLAAAEEREVARIKAGVYSAEELERRNRRDAPIGKALDSYLQSKKDILSPDWWRTTESYLTRFVAETKVKCLGDITPELLEGFIAAKGRIYAGGATANAWWASIGTFLRWCRKRKLISSLPMEEAEKPAPWTGRPDRRRRAMTDAEFDRLIAAVGTAASRSPMPNGTWAWALRIARFTGLRSKEISSLTRASFRGLATESPFIVCAAGDTKNGDEARQPVPRFLAPQLDAWVRAQPAGVRLFLYQSNAGRRLRGNLKKAGVEFMTDEGRVDFHSLRVTYVTWLVRANANFKVVQTLARHGDPKLTFNTYARLNMTDLREAIEGASVAYSPSAGGVEDSPSGNPDTPSGILEVVSAWPTLPEPFRSAILAVVAAGRQAQRSA